MHAQSTTCTYTQNTTNTVIENIVAAEVSDVPWFREVVTGLGQEMQCGALTMYVRGEFVVVSGGYFIRVVVGTNHCRPLWVKSCMAQNKLLSQRIHTAWKKYIVITATV